MKTTDWKSKYPNFYETKKFIRCDISLMKLILALEKRFMVQNWRKLHRWYLEYGFTTFDW